MANTSSVSVKKLIEKMGKEDVKVAFEEDAINAYNNRIQELRNL